MLAIASLACTDLSEARLARPVSKARKNKFKLHMLPRTISSQSIGDQHISPPIGAIVYLYICVHVSMCVYIYICIYNHDQDMRDALLHIKLWAPPLPPTFLFCILVSTIHGIWDGA